MDNDEVIKLLVKKQGDRTQKEVAEEIGISPQYLHDVLNGGRKPSERILDYLGLKREIVKVR